MLLKLSTLSRRVRSHIAKLSFLFNHCSFLYCLPHWLPRGLRTAFHTGSHTVLSTPCRVTMWHRRMFFKNVFHKISVRLHRPLSIVSLVLLFFTDATLVKCSLFSYFRFLFSNIKSSWGAHEDTNTSLALSASRKMLFNGRCSMKKNHAEFSAF